MRKPRGDINTLLFVGLFHSPVSWSKVLRYYAIYAQKLGYTVFYYPRRGYFYSGQILDERILQLSKIEHHNQLPSADVTITFEYPANYRFLPKNSFKVGLLVYETDVLPPDWVKNINKYLDLLIVPSEFNYQIFSKHPIKVPIEIVPYGVDTALYLPEQNMLKRERTLEPLRFLHIALPHKRKATHIVIDVFREVFKRQNSALLYIKTPGTKKVRKSWEIDIESLLLPYDKNIKIIKKALTEEDMAKLFQWSHLFLQPSFSEGFGMAILESFSCAIPAVVTGYGGHMDFCNDLNSFILDYSIVPAREIQYDIDKVDNESKIAQPNIAEFKRTLQLIAEDPTVIYDKARVCRETALCYDWEKVTRQLLKTIKRHYNSPRRWS